MKKTLFFFIIIFSLNLFAQNSGTEMWKKATETGRPVSVLLTLTGMATTPLLIPVSIYGMYDGEMNIFLCPLVGTVVGAGWIVINEIIGVADILTFGYASYYERSSQRDLIMEAITKPAYFYYIDGIDNLSEHIEKEKKKKADINRDKPIQRAQISAFDKDQQLKTKTISHQITTSAFDADIELGDGKINAQDQNIHSWDKKLK